MFMSNSLNINYVLFLLYYFLFIFTISPVQSRKISKDCLQCDKNQSFSFFWKIERLKPSPPSFFFGTIHAPYTKVWNYVPSRAKSAFRNSHHVIFELDLMNADTLLSLIRCQLLPPGIRLSDIIPIDLYQRLQRHLKYVKYKMPLWITDEQKSHGLNPNSLFNAITLHWERKRPIWVMIMLNSLTENDIKSKGITVLDSFFYQKAKKLKKSIGSVENAQEQCVTLNYLNTTQVLYALNQTLIQHESIRRGMRRSNHTTDDMIRHYNCGNLNEALFSEDSANIPMLKNHSNLIAPQELEIAKDIENYFRFEIILKRNKRMSQRVLELLSNNPNKSFFFIFGAGHFLGNDSIIELIKEKSTGLKISHINDTKHLIICDQQKQQKHQINIGRYAKPIATTKMNNDGDSPSSSNDDHSDERTIIYPISSVYAYHPSSYWSHHSLNFHPWHRSSLSSSDIASYYQNSFGSDPIDPTPPNQYWLPSYRQSNLYPTMLMGQSNQQQNQQQRRFHSNIGPYNVPNDLSQTALNNQNNNGYRSSSGHSHHHYHHHQQQQQKYYSGSNNNNKFASPLFAGYYQQQTHQPDISSYMMNGAGYHVPFLSSTTTILSLGSMLDSARQYLALLGYCFVLYINGWINH